MESKGALFKRLERSGEWPAADRFREEVRTRLRREGKTRREAREAAWEAVATRYPPPEPEPPVLDTPVEGDDTDDDADIQRNVVEPVVAAAEAEVERWVGKFDVPIPEDARAELVGGIVGYFWAMGLMEEVPQTGVDRVEAAGVGETGPVPVAG